MGQGERASAGTGRVLLDCYGVEDSKKESGGERDGRCIAG